MFVCGYFLYMAYVMNAVYSERTIRPAETVVMVCAGVFMSAFKGGIYIPLLLLLFMIPKRNFGEKVKYPVVVASAILLAVVTFAAVNSNILKMCHHLHRAARTNLCGPRAKDLR